MNFSRLRRLCGQVAYIGGFASAALVILLMAVACALRALKHARPFTEQGKIGKSRWRKFDIAAAVPTR